MNFPKNASKQQKGIVLRYLAHFVEKKVFANIYPLLLVLLKKSCLNKSKISSRYATFKHGKKKKFLTISVLVSEIVTFMSKKESSQ